MIAGWLTSFEQEREVLPRSVRLADVLRVVRPAIHNIDGWPTKIGRALHSIVRAFDATACLWGWEGIIPPDSARSGFLEERREWVRENLERPMYEAAVSWQAGCRDAEHCPVDDLADEGRRRGLVPTMTAEEGRARFEPARSRLNREPHIGKCYPKIGDQESAELIRAFNVLRPHMLEIAPDRCGRPPWQEQPVVRPAAVPRSTDAPTAALGTTTASTCDAATVCGSLTRNDERKRMVRDQVFISYSHQDRQFLDELLAHLKPLRRAGHIVAWSDEQIRPGSQWFAEIQSALASAKVAVLLVTKDFLASDFIHEHELGPLLKEGVAGGVKILWVLIRDCLYKETPLKDYQAVVSPPDKPLAMMRAERDTAWKKVCEAIIQAANRP